MVTAASEAMAVCSDRTFALMAESLASCEYPESAKKPIVASIANIVMTTMSSTKVKPWIRRREGRTSEVFSRADVIFSIADIGI